MTNHFKKNECKKKGESRFSIVNQNCAGIDIGSKSLFVAAPKNSSTNTVDCDVEEFLSFTSDVHKLIAWLKERNVQSVVMESTGSYWIPLFKMLNDEGFDVKLVDARQVKHLPGRTKTDVSDCKWLQQLHTFGLLDSAFVPENAIQELRIYMNRREILIKHSSIHVQHMQKALIQMNVKLDNVISDILGKTGMTIIAKIIDGERDPKVLAKYRDRRCKCKPEEIEKSLEGHFDEANLFALKQAYDLYYVIQARIEECDQRINSHLQKLEDQSIYKHTSIEPSKKKTQSKAARKNAPIFDVRSYLIKIYGVDITAVPGVNTIVALIFLAVVGTNLSFWRNEKAFASWLGLCPLNKISGGRILSSRTKRCTNRLAIALRIAAQSLYNDKSTIGAFFRRMRRVKGGPKAVTATAHKIAVVLYKMITEGKEYRELGEDYYEKMHHQRVVSNAVRTLDRMGYKVALKTAE